MLFALKGIFAPYWTDYKRKVNLCEYDVTDKIVSGGFDNVVNITVANGWYAGRLGYTIKSGVYGKKLALYAVLRVDYNDGESQMILPKSKSKTTGFHITSAKTGG